MKEYANHRYIIIEGDNEVITTSKTDRFCVVLSIIAFLIFIVGIVLMVGIARAEQRQEIMNYSEQMQQQLNDLMEFNL